ncbi:MAG: hypothetical protein J5829_07315 [Lachnospiraceae bacterium]|nr:hypothetical protein [Lachnospiraceae bacterium]
MSLITEEMALEYHRCRIYKDYIEQLQISEKNEKDEFMNSLRCSTVYVPTPAEVTEKYRKEAMEQGIDREWIDRFMPEIKGQ